MKHSKGHVLKGIIEAKARAIANDMMLRGRTPVAEHLPLLTLKGVQIIPSEYLEEGKKQILQNFASALYKSSAVHWTITDDHDPILRGHVRLEGTLRVVGPKEDN